MSTIKVKKISNKAILPKYATDGSSGFDLYSTINYILEPGDRILIPTDLIMEIPNNFEIQIRPRSGIALKHGVTVLNSPGTLDEDYIGVIGVILINHSKQAFKIEEGDRIAQGVLAKVCDRFKFELVDEIVKETQRGQGGFGSSGK